MVFSVYDLKLVVKKVRDELFESSSGMISKIFKHIVVSNIKRRENLTINELSGTVYFIDLLVQ